MRLPEMQTLFKIAAFTTFGGVSSLVYIQFKKLEEISNSDYFREAFKILRAHKGAVQFLGEPIKQLGFSLNSPENVCTSEKAQFKVRVKGPNDKGIMHLWASAKDGQWSVNRIELELKKQPDRRLIIKDGPTALE